jgi:hypothetical protein
MQSVKMMGAGDQLPIRPDSRIHGLTLGTYLKGVDSPVRQGIFPSFKSKDSGG